MIAHLGLSGQTPHGSEMEPSFTSIKGKDYFPDGKTCAVVFSIDDVHPSTSKDDYEAGGDMEKGVLRHLYGLQEKHPELVATLFVTADWRQKNPAPTSIARHIPYLRDKMYLAPLHKAGAMQLDRHAAFCESLASQPGLEIAWHGLHHVHRGLPIGMEFQDEPLDCHFKKLQEIQRIFHSAGLSHARGICPPLWNASPEFISALDKIENQFLASSRDIITPVSHNARSAMSGIKGTPLIHACHVSQQTHFTSNFQATSAPERAMSILRSGGILAIKGHIVKQAFGHLALDAVDALYCNYLDVLFSRLKMEFGPSIWWTSMGELDAQIRGTY